MSIIETICPNCNQVFRYRDFDAVISCTHCGYQYNNRNYKTKKNYEGLELAKALSNLIEPLRKKQELEERIERYEKQLEVAKKHIKTDRSYAKLSLDIQGLFIAGFVIIMLFFYNPIVLFIEEPTPESLSEMIGFIIVLFSPLVFFFSYRPARIKHEEILEYYPELLEKTTEELSETEKILYSLGYESLPEGYNDEDAIIFLIDALSDRRANTLSDALKLCSISRNLNLNKSLSSGHNSKSPGCPKCGSRNISIISEQTTSGSDYNVGSGICGTICLGPIGVLCGMSGGKKIINTHYYICNNCKYKWRV
ncbi:MAG: hypothetical protein J5829_07365 [Lachnospiraceae bacterium]|nr:hypothetical protein [Lachnospiraceae bacterium]